MSQLQVQEEPDHLPEIRKRCFNLALAYILHPIDINVVAALYAHKKEMWGKGGFQSEIETSLGCEVWRANSFKLEVQSTEKFTHKCE